MRDEWDLDITGVPHPLLFECDREGRVLWMSSYTREVLGDRPLPEAITEYLRTGESFRVWRAFALPDTLLLAAQLEPEEPSTIGDWNGELLGNYFRLQRAERKLAAAAQQRRRAEGRTPVLDQLERERQRIGRELHTGVGQLLAAIRLQAETAVTQLPHAAEAVTEALDRIRQLSEDALQQVRSVSRRIYPPDWQGLSVCEALEKLWDSTGMSRLFKGGLHMAACAEEPAQEVKVVLYRTAQEALSNITRHAVASDVKMSLHIAGDRVVLTLCDNGQGFNVDKAMGKDGMGLRSIRDAAYEIGGELSVESGPQGTTLKLEAPIHYE